MMEVGRDNPGKACIKQRIGNSIQDKHKSKKEVMRSCWGSKTEAKKNLSMAWAKKRFLITHN
jgi:hypothetical protein